MTAKFLSLPSLYHIFLFSAMLEPSAEDSLCNHQGKREPLLSLFTFGLTVSNSGSFTKH